MAGNRSNPLMMIGSLAGLAAATYFTGGFGLGALGGAEGAAAAGEGLTFTTTAAETGAEAAAADITGAGAASLGADAAMAGGGLLESTGLAASLDRGLMTFASDQPAAGSFISGTEANTFGMAPGTQMSPIPPGGGGEAFINGSGGFSPAAPAISTPADAAPASEAGDWWDFGKSLVGKPGTGALLTYGEAGGLGLAGVSGVVKSNQASQDAGYQQSVLDAQSGQAKLAAAAQEVDSQRRLAQTLAGQTVAFYGRGQQVGGGTARALAEGADNAADMEANLTEAQSSANDWIYAAKSAQLAARRSNSWLSPLFDIGEAGLGIYRTRSLVGGL